MVRRCDCGCKEMIKDDHVCCSKNFKTLDNGEKPRDMQMIRTFVHCKCCNKILGTFRHWGDY